MIWVVVSGLAVRVVAVRPGGVGSVVTEWLGISLCTSGFKIGFGRLRLTESRK